MGHFSISCISACFSLGLAPVVPSNHRIFPNISSRAASCSRPARRFRAWQPSPSRRVALLGDRCHGPYRPPATDTTRVCVHLSLGPPIFPFSRLPYQYYCCQDENAEVRRGGQHAFAARFRGRCPQQPLLPVAARLLLQQGRQGRPASPVESGRRTLGSHHLCQTLASTHDRECPLSHPSECLVIPRQPDRQQRTRWVAHSRLWRK